MLIIEYFNTTALKSFKPERGNIFKLFSGRISRGAPRRAGPGGHLHGRRQGGLQGRGQVRGLTHPTILKTPPPPTVPIKLFP